LGTQITVPYASVKNTVLQTTFSAILPTGNTNNFTTGGVTYLQVLIIFTLFLIIYALFLGAICFISVDITQTTLFTVQPVNKYRFGNRTAQCK